jgi:hypothetical protein
MLSALVSFGLLAPPAGIGFLDPGAAEPFARLALVCVHKEYPNKIAHVLNGDADVGPPRELTPAFYGCYDWHSSVHGHWLLARLARTFPESPFAPAAKAALADGAGLTLVHFGGGQPVHGRRMGRSVWRWSTPLAATG